MRRTLILAGLAILIGGWLGTMMMRDPGYLLISYGGAALQTSLWFALLVIALGVLLVVLALRLVRLGFSSGTRLNLWRTGKRQGRARRFTSLGLISLVEGDWQRAGRYLAAVAGESETPLVNYLGAARAAHEQGDFETRDRFLKEAGELVPEAEMAIGITQAQLQYSRGQMEQCLATLKRLPDKPQVVSMLARVYRDLGEWERLWQLLPAMKRGKVESSDVLQALEADTARHLLDRLRHERAGSTAERLAKSRELWRALSKPARADASVAGRYLRCLYALDAQQDADRLLLRTLKSDWSDRLVDLYGSLSAPDAGAQLKTAEKLDKRHPDNARVKLALARIARALGRTDAAREHLRASLAIEESPEALQELGVLLAREGDQAEGAGLLARAVAMRNDTDSDADSGTDIRPLTTPMI